MNDIEEETYERLHLLKNLAFCLCPKCRRKTVEILDKIAEKLKVDFKNVH